jgi:hypothetical protein
MQNVSILRARAEAEQEPGGGLGAGRTGPVAGARAVDEGRLHCSPRPRRGHLSSLDPREEEGRGGSFRRKENWSRGILERTPPAPRSGGGRGVGGFSSPASLRLGPAGWRGGQGVGAPAAAGIHFSWGQLGLPTPGARESARPGRSRPLTISLCSQ